VDTIWCQGNQNIGLFNHKLKFARTLHRVITRHARPGQKDRQMNVIAIARRFAFCYR